MVSTWPMVTYRPFAGDSSSSPAVMGYGIIKDFARLFKSTPCFAQIEFGLSVPLVVIA